MGMNKTLSYQRSVRLWVLPELGEAREDLVSIKLEEIWTSFFLPGSGMHICRPGDFIPSVILDPRAVSSRRLSLWESGEIILQQSAAHGWPLRRAQSYSSLHMSLELPQGGRKTNCLPWPIAIITLTGVFTFPWEWRMPFKNILRYFLRDCTEL